MRPLAPRPFRRALFALAAGCLLGSGTALAQNGADTCANATVITGFGTFPFDNTGASIDGPADCNNQPVRRDIWYVWTAPVTDRVVFRTCGLTNLETRIAVYDGFDCSTFPLIDCSIAFCGGQSQIPFDVVAGQSYLFRVGSRYVGDQGSGAFELFQDPCTQIPDDGFEDNDTCFTATPLTDGAYAGLFVSKIDDDYYAFDVAPGATINIDILFFHSAGDLDLFLIDGCGGGNLDTGFSASDDENVSWNNPDACDRRVYLHVDHWYPDANSECNTYDLLVSGSGGSGNPCSGGNVVVACDPANAHSGGSFAALDATGSFVATDPSPMHLECVDGPAGEFGYFLVSGTLVDPGVPVSQGLLCVGSPQGRYNPVSATNAGNPALSSLSQFDAAGVMQNLVGTSTAGSGFDVPRTLPPPIGVDVQPGDSWVFQVWYRDGLVSNFSNALVVTFN